jgi:hypothetical protein
MPAIIKFLRRERIAVVRRFKLLGLTVRATLDYETKWVPRTLTVTDEDAERLLAHPAVLIPLLSLEGPVEQIEMDFLPDPKPEGRRRSCATPMMRRMH